MTSAAGSAAKSWGHPPIATVVAFLLEDEHGSVSNSEQSSLAIVIFKDAYTAVASGDETGENVNDFRIRTASRASKAERDSYDSVQLMGDHCALIAGQLVWLAFQQRRKFEEKLLQEGAVTVMNREERP